MWKSNYKSLDIDGLILEVKKLKSFKYYDPDKLAKLAFLANEFLIKVN